MTSRIDISPDTVRKAEGLTQTLMGLSAGPAEAVSILTVMLCGILSVGMKDRSKLDANLQQIVADVKHNLKLMEDYEAKPKATVLGPDGNPMQ